MPYKDPAKAKEHHRQYNAAHKPQRKAYLERYKDKARVAHREQNQVFKRKAFEAYGGCFCACCGEAHIEFLSIDHIAGDGAEHRRELQRHSRGTVFYRWLSKHHYPPGFRVLCFNCNFALGAYHACPHGNLPAANATANSGTGQISLL